MFLVVVVNLADRQIINILAQDIKAELALSDAQLGLLTGLAFGLVYALVGLPMAWLADRVDRTKIIALMLAFWSLCTVACGAASGFVGLFLARMGVGIGEGGAQPACTALVRDLFPQRGTTALALAMAGNPVGSFVGFLAGGAIAGQWGWRAAFVLAGLPGLLLAAIVWAKVGDARPAPVAEAHSRSFHRSLGDIVGRPRVRLLVVSISASMLVMYAVSAWMPTYFIRVHGLSTTEMGLYGALATGLCGGLGTVAGFLCDRLGPRVRHAENWFLIAGAAGAVPMLLVSVGARDTSLALLGYCVLNAITFAWLAPATRLIQDAVGPDQRALVFAVCGGAGLLFSLGVGVPLIGWASDLLAPQFGIRSLGVALAFALPLAAAVALGGYFRLLATSAPGPRPD